jgi:hypothetical protein
MKAGKTIKEYYEEKGYKDLTKYTIWVNGEKKDLDYILEEDDQVILLPILKGG